MENLPPPNEKKLPSPNEKLLRVPTFWEKYEKTLKWLTLVIILISLLLLIFASILFLRTPKFPTTLPLPTPPASPMPTPTSIIQPEITSIEISSDKKSILNAETKKIIFTIEDTKKYLKNSGYEYNPDTFQTTNAKYEGSCFIDAALSNNKNRIVFSTGCLSGDLPQPWIGVYGPINIKCPPNALCKIAAPKIKFLTAGRGKNFTWSPDDTTITYEADLGLSGQTQPRAIDSNTGETLENKNIPTAANPETSN